MTEKHRRAIWGSPESPLKIGNIELPCYVLEDGTRVLSGRGMQTALSLGQGHGGILKEFLGKKSIKPYIDNELAMALDSPIRFVRPGRGGKLAVGYEATVLVDVCNAVVEASEKGSLTGSQLLVVQQCKILIRSIAKVGIIALVDEATGYQEVRDRLALQKILEKYITDEWAKWTKTFPDEFYRELFRLKNIPYPPVSARRPSYIGHWTNDIVYSRLTTGVLSELKKKNPVQVTGRRKRKHHQYLTRDIGHPALKEHLSNVIFLMKSCSAWDDFKRRLNRAKPKVGDTLDIPFDYDDES